MMPKYMLQLDNTNPVKEFAIALDTVLERGIGGRDTVMSAFEKKRRPNDVLPVGIVTTY